MQQDIISENVKTAYDSYYETHDGGWRLLGAKYKAQRIIDVSEGHTFNTALEVGAGDGSILKLLSDSGFAKQYSAVEISESGVERIKAQNIANLKSVQIFDGYKLPFADDEFDVVILSHVLEHVEHERILLRELRRVAKMCLIEVPKDYRYGVDERLDHFLGYGHINMYTPTLLRYLLLTEGFTIASDIPSMITPDVTRFYKPKGAFSNFRILVEYAIKKLLCGIGGKRITERFASSYTVLCGKQANAPKLF